jgi:thymidylate synthase (FAD)
MKVELLRITPESEELIEIAGRTCYRSKVGDPSIIQKWIRSGHHSLLEHASATFRITEASRALTHQLVRHRIGFSYSQQSQRYVSEDNFEYVTPDDIKKDEALLREYEDVLSRIRWFYKMATSKGVKKENARFVLPNACHTEIVVTMNFRAARNFLELRLDKAAQWEIRRLANYILSVLKEHAPNVFYDMEVEE